MNETNFNREKIYYPFILNYIVSLHGLIEIISRDSYKTISEAIEKGIDQSEYITSQSNGNEEMIKFYQTAFKANLIPTSLIGEITLKSNGNKDPIKIDVNELAKEYRTNIVYILPFLLKSAGMLLLSAYEASPASKLEKSNTLWNFLYHCRNAIAHNGKLNITNSGKKRLPAKWNEIEITESMHGQNLFKNDEEEGLLSTADPIYLLHEIENTLL